MASRLFASFTLAFVVVACSTREPAHEPVVGGPGPDRTAVAWRCSDVDLVFFPGEGGRARLRVNEELREVKLRPTKMGMEYADDQVAFWARGGEALVTLPDTARTCYYDPAKTDLEEARLRGVTFRVVGGSPEWALEIGTEKTTMSAPAPIEVPSVAPTTDEATGVMTWSASDETHMIIVAATPRACTNGTTGRTSPWTVEATVDGTPWRGCGEEID